MADINTLPYKKKTARNLIDLHLKDPFSGNEYNNRILKDADALCNTFPHARYESSGANTLWSMDVMSPEDELVRLVFFVRHIDNRPVIFI